MKYIVLLLVLLSAAVCSGHGKKKPYNLNHPIRFDSGFVIHLPDTIPALLLVVDTVETNRQGNSTGEEAVMANSSGYYFEPIRYPQTTTPVVIQGYYVWGTFPFVCLDRKKRPLDPRYMVLNQWQYK